MVLDTVGSIICAASYWLLSWQLSMVLTQLVLLLLLVAATIFFLEETPMELVTSKSSSRALSGFQKIAWVNGVECDISEA